MKQTNNNTPSIMITIDVEDWFQVENFKPYIPFSTWDSRELRVEQNVHKLLDLFDSFSDNSIRTVEEDDETQIVAKDKEKIDIYQLHPEGEQETKSSKSCLPSEIRRSFHRGRSCQKKNSKFKIQNSKLPKGHGNSKFKTKNLKFPSRIKTTFFVLGWIAERVPNLVREIQKRGHEVASHGYNHDLCGAINHTELKQDLIKSKQLLEAIIGSEIYGYRAPSFSIDDGILKVIEDCGYKYDSSYNSFGLHGRYGKVNLNGQPQKGIAYKISDSFYEIPISNLKIKMPFLFYDRKTGFKVHSEEAEDNSTNQTNSKNPTNPTNTMAESSIPASQHPSIPASIELPWGGGGYFRLIPQKVFYFGVTKILKRSEAYLFYLHPWELDPFQPLVEQAKWSYRFRHYNNLHRTENKLKSIIQNFRYCNFVSCREYLRN